MQGDAIAIDDAVAKVDAIAGKSNNSFDEDVMVALVVGCWTEEDDGLIVLELAVGKKGRHGRGRCKGDALDQDMVSHQQGAGHRCGRDGEVLKRKAMMKRPTAKVEQMEANSCSAELRFSCEGFFITVFLIVRRRS